MLGLSEELRFYLFTGKVNFRIGSGDEGPPGLRQKMKKSDLKNIYLRSSHFCFAKIRICGSINLPARKQKSETDKGGGFLRDSPMLTPHGKRGLSTLLHVDKKANMLYWFLIPKL